MDRHIRLRFSNNFGAQAITLGSVTVALQNYAGNLVPDTITKVTFSGSASVFLPVGQEIYSDPVRLRFGRDSDDPALVGRKLAISEYVKGISGPLTWHAKAVTTSYITPQNSGDHTVINPPSTGPAAVDRLDRDVLGLSGLTSVVWLEGINDLGAGHAVNDIIAGYVNVVQRLHTAGVKVVVGCTITSALLSTGADGGPAVDANRKILNSYIRTLGNFDRIADFDAATIDPSTGGLQPEFVPNSSVGGAGDNLHPNRAGYQAMANTIDLKVLAPPQQGPPR